MNIGKLKSYVVRWARRAYGSEAFAPAVVGVAAVAAIVAQLLIFESYVHAINPWLDVPWMQTVADALVIVAPFVWLRGRWRLAIWAPVVGVTAFCYVNLWYCRAFYDLMPLESVGMAGNMEGPVIGAFLQMVYRWDWLMALPPLALAVVMFALRRRWLRGHFGTWCQVIVPIVAALAWCGAYAMRAYDYHADNRRKEPFSHTLTHYFDLTKEESYKFTQHLSRMGYVGYWLWQIDYTLFPRSITDDERRSIEQCWERQRQANGARASDYAHNRGRNLIFVIAESLSADAVDLVVNGVEVTPNLNRLIRGDSTAVVALDMMPQAGHGRSSDGQFIYNTGLLPLRNSVVAKRYPAADYPSLAKALGYATRFEVIGERPTFYNHSTTNISYGYGKLYHAPTEVWLNDKQIFEQAIEHIKNAAAPMCVEITTLNLHDPYDESGENTAIWADESLDARDRHYLERVRVFDSNLGGFIRDLKAEGVFENSVIVIASDHEPRKSCLGPDMLSSRIVFVALNTGRPGMRVEQVVGQVDVFPTVLDIMGIADYAYPGLGASMLSLPSAHGAVDGQGAVYGTSDSAALARLRQAWDLSELMIEGRYFK